MGWIDDGTDSFAAAMFAVIAIIIVMGRAIRSDRDARRTPARAGEPGFDDKRSDTCVAGAAVPGAR